MIVDFRISMIKPLELESFKKPKLIYNNTTKQYEPDGVRRVVFEGKDVIYSQDVDILAFESLKNYVTILYDSYLHSGSVTIPIENITNEDIKSIVGESIDLLA